MSTAWILTMTACGLFAPDLAFLDTPAPEPGAPTPYALPLARGGDVSLQLPSMNRPDDLPAAEEFPLVGSFSRHKTVEEVDIYTVPIPVAVHLMPHEQGGTHLIGGAPPVDFVVTGPDGPLEFAFPRAREPHSWGFDRHRLYVGLPKGSPAPNAAEYRVRFPKAKRAEDGLNYATSGQPSERFARRAFTVFQTSRTGLYLPAPARATFPIVVPEAGRLTLTGTLLEPAIRHEATSDGAMLQVRVEQGSDATTIGEIALAVGQNTPGHFDLSAFAGQSVDLVLETLPGASKDFDYVFLEAPVVSTAGQRPRRILALFIDTLRPDHLGFMGYHRDTSPTLDRLAAQATVFTEARSVAPWTLPSARAAFSGYQPERWAEVSTLADQLSALGFRTEGYVTNAFLSAPFGMQRGFDRYRFHQLRPAKGIVDEIEGIVEAYADRDLFVLAHFMEPHLPYDEPWTYRFRYTGFAPSGLTRYARSGYASVQPDDPAFAPIADHFVGRYDQNIAAVDHAIGRALAAMGPDATILLFSDHGEEFWEHGAYEHGHAFWDEVLRVPLVIRSPGLPPGRIDAPVSLLDLTPTIVDLAGGTPEAAGTSLLPLARGETGAVDALAARPQAFGRPLYDEDGWGVVAQGSKWWSRGGKQARYDLAADPSERRNVVTADDATTYAKAMGEVLDRRVDRVWRFSFDARRPWSSDVLVTVSHPEGLDDAWLAYAPRGTPVAPPVIAENGRLHITIPAGLMPPAAMYVRPKGDVTQIRGMALSIVGKGLVAGSEVNFDLREADPEDRGQFLRIGKPTWQVAVDFSWVPEDSGGAVEGFHPELTAELQELGYLE